MQLTNEEMKIAKRKYVYHLQNCRNRIDRNGNLIEMRLTFEQWIDIWLQSGHWHERGCKRGHYVMSRYNDLGHYEIGNVVIKTIGDNVREMINSDQWRASNKLAGQQLKNNNQWREANKLGKEKMKNSDNWKESMSTMHQNPIFRAKNKAAVQKANSKSISCDGIIYPSRTAAALALAPAHLTDKTRWFHRHMTKYPDRFFYI